MNSIVLIEDIHLSVVRYKPHSQTDGIACLQEVGSLLVGIRWQKMTGVSSDGTGVNAAAVLRQ